MEQRFKNFFNQMAYNGRCQLKKSLDVGEDKSQGEFCAFPLGYFL